MDPIAGVDAVGRPGGEFDDGVRAGAAVPGPGGEPPGPADLPAGQPQRIDVERDEHHVEPPHRHPVEREDERVLLGDRAPGHQAPGLREQAIGDIHVAGQRPPSGGGLVNDAHGGRESGPRKSLPVVSVATCVPARGRARNARGGERTPEENY